MPRSQRALRYREGSDTRGRTAYSQGEPSLRTNAEQQTSAFVKSGVRAPPSNTVLPAITGTTTEGQTLTCSAGTFVSSTGASITHVYQWMRNDSFPIPTATAATRVLTAADVGHSLRCRVTATDTHGATAQASLRTDKIRVVPAP